MVPTPSGIPYAPFTGISPFTGGIGSQHQMPQDRSHGSVPSSGIPYPSEIPYPRDTLLPSWIPYPPATEIWWWSLETCSNFFTWEPTPSCTPVLTSSGGHRGGRYASYWNAVLLELTSHVIRSERPRRRSVLWFLKTYCVFTSFDSTCIMVTMGIKWFTTRGISSI